MRVLWFCSTFFPEACKSLGFPLYVKCGWMSSLGHALAKTENIELGVAVPSTEVPYNKITFSNSTHYVIPLDKNTAAFELTIQPSTSLIDDCIKIINDFKPDIIHIHGTEYFYGLIPLLSNISMPSVISLQGLIGPYSRYYFGSMSMSEIIKCHSVYGLIRKFGLIFEYRLWQRRAKVTENEIIRGNNNFIGRTLWDFAHLKSINPKANYYHCDEIIREPFYNVRWNINSCHRFSIFASTASYPLKGFHWLIKAVALVRRYFPMVTLRVADANFHSLTRWNSYNNYLNYLIRSLGLIDCVFPLGQLTAEKMAEELTSANVFVIPSLIENSPNSLAEAMIVGTPTVSSFVGGIPSMVCNNETSLCFPPGDERVMAECINMILEDDDLANRLSENARVVAINRHLESGIVSKMIYIYGDVLECNK